MSLKDIIRRKKLIEQFGHKMEVTLPGEPLIYSVGKRLPNRLDPQDWFRDKQFVPKLRCIFPSYSGPSTPVVLIVHFYVSPFPFVDVPDKLVRKEAVAVHAYEICEYLLSLMQTIRLALIATYRQIVHISAEKYYSKDPRTVLKFMSWSNYETLLRGENPVDAPTQQSCNAFGSEPVPPAGKGQARNEKLHLPGHSLDGHPAILGPGDGGDMVLPAARRVRKQKPTGDSA